MKTFRLMGDFTFEAEDLEDAFAKLANHFQSLVTELNDHDADGMGSGDVFFIGSLTVRPV